MEYVILVDAWHQTRQYTACDHCRAVLEVVAIAGQYLEGIHHAAVHFAFDDEVGPTVADCCELVHLIAAAAFVEVVVDCDLAVG